MSTFRQRHLLACCRCLRRKVRCRADPSLCSAPSIKQHRVLHTRFDADPWIKIEVFCNYLGHALSIGSQHSKRVKAYKPEVPNVPAVPGLHAGVLENVRKVTFECLDTDIQLLWSETCCTYLDRRRCRGTLLSLSGRRTRGGSDLLLESHRVHTDEQKGRRASGLEGAG